MDHLGSRQWRGDRWQHHDLIFDVFRRLHHAHEQPGTGIGLAICRRVVHSHHGDICVKSAPGKGSKFCFTVPIRRDER